MQVPDFPGCAADKNLLANAGDKGSIPGPGRSHTPLHNQTSASQLLSQAPRVCALQQGKPKNHNQEQARTAAIRGSPRKAMRPKIQLKLQVSICVTNETEKGLRFRAIVKGAYNL